MRHRSCSLVYGFYTKSYTKSAVSKSSIALGRLNFTFYRLDYLHETSHTCSSCSWLPKYAADFLIFAQGLSYGLIIAWLLHIAHGPSGPVCHLPYMPDLQRSPLRALHGWGDTLLFYLEWSRTPSPRCPRPPNAHALRTKLMPVKRSIVNFERRIASMPGTQAGQPFCPALAAQQRTTHFTVSCKLHSFT